MIYFLIIFFYILLFNKLAQNLAHGLVLRVLVLVMGKDKLIPSPRFFKKFK